MKKAWIGALLFSLSCASSAPDDLESVLARHVAARGGAQSVAAVNSIRVLVNVEEPSFTVEVRYVADRKGRVRVDVFAGGQRVFSEGIDEQGGWQMGQSGPVKPTTEAGTAALEHGRLTNLYGLHEFPAFGHRLTLEGRREVGGRAYDVVRIDYSDGMQTWRYVDVETGLITIERNHRALHPDVDPTRVETESRVSDFRTVSGVVYPFASRETAIAANEWLQTTLVKSIEVNPPLTEAELRRP
jgi:hypothetical protein